MSGSPRPAVLVLAAAESAAAVARAAAASGLTVRRTDTLAGLLRELRGGSWAVTALSLDAAHVDGDVARRIANEGASGALVLLSSRVSLETALAAESVGAVALLREPLDPHELETVLGRSLDEGPEVRIPPLDGVGGNDAGRDDAVPALIGESEAMSAVFATVARVARSGSTVLLTGESGTGKEVVARALHWASDRRTEPFVAVNCAAIPEHLLESELFGHEKGAFTGAVARRVGRFERASGGTLFLDEIGDMSLVLQAKVLRALEERSVERVGGDAVPVDVRVVAATNRDLARAIEDGSFREDLYYRLAVVELALPPLRERGDDIRLLALHFAALFALRHERPVQSITEEALARLTSAPWHGNVRELRNVMDRAVLLARGATIRASDLRIGPAAPSASARGDRAHPPGYAPTLSLEAVEADHIRRVLEAVGGHLGDAAVVLGIHRNTLTRKIQSYGPRA